MEALEVSVAVLLLIIIGLAIFISFSIAFDVKKVEYEPYVSPKNERIVSGGIQFYPQMRFPEKEISYWIEEKCSEKKKEDIKKTFEILSERTILSFYKSEKKSRILFLCSEISPESDQKNHFVAGEGGPTEIINLSSYFIMLESKVSLYRDDVCEEPKIALHEILHSLGFDHTANKKSIMFPVTNCKQELDNFIVDEINRLYSVESAPDLIIDSVIAFRIGKYLNINVNISNMGFVDVEDANISIYDGNSLIKSYSLKEEGVPLGSKMVLSFQNLRVEKDIKNIRLAVVPLSPKNDINLKNNEVVISVSEPKE